jgi:TRAP-type C4-dicarboxylate transport system permease small subunit
VFVWRNAIILGVGFVIVGVLYYLLQGGGEWLDRTGATLLILLGVAMSFTFAILLRGSRGL